MMPGELREDLQQKLGFDAIAILNAIGLTAVPRHCFIPLTVAGMATLVSEQDVERVLAEGNWHPIHKDGKIYIARAKTHNSRTYLHRFILNCSDPKLHVDHINGDTQDNRRGNLRAVPASVNLRNRGGPQANSKSGARGIYWHKQREKWAAQITTEGRKIFLGLHETLEGAIQARELAERKVWSKIDRFRSTSIPPVIPNVSAAYQYMLSSSPFNTQGEKEE